MTKIALSNDFMANIDITPEFEVSNISFGDVVARKEAQFGHPYLERKDFAVVC
jgi:hypothetical protein